VKIKGLDKLAKDAEQASKAMKNLDGDLGGVKFDPNDPASIERAIVEMEVMVDERIGTADKNPFVAPVAQAMKDSYRQQILDLAAQKRLEGGSE